MSAANPTADSTTTGTATTTTPPPSISALEAEITVRRERLASTIDELTPQELQIARFVAEGLSNKEVAAQLFLSPRTIEYHLRHVFTKLGITSRTQLARLPLGDAAPAAEPAGVSRI